MEKPKIVLHSSGGIWGTWVSGGHHVRVINGTDYVRRWECGAVCAEVSVGQG